MKKIMLLIGILLVLVLCFTSCLDNGSDTNTPDKEQEKTVYETLNELKAAEYNSITLTNKTQVGEDTLNAEYRIVKSGSGCQVSFSYQKIAEFDTEDPVVLTDRIQTKSGSCTVDSKGNITAKSGDELNVSITGIGLSGFDFSEKNFTDVSASGGSLTAKVKNAKNFCGIDGASDMSLTVKYTAKQISSITIRYTKSGAQITSTYTVG